ncbi:InlB B-repeat-containing protein [Paenibacillus sp. FSL H8-0537]|uniref:InlB B-repeat-containing protein n=1 Tax=Paenibacillus sp. FSL H8-0537 TaxID=2921399 RepID=UPI003101440B
MKQVIKQAWKLKSRLLALMIAISMLVSLLPVPQVAATEPSSFQNMNRTDEFQDVSITDWFYDEVVYAQQNGLFNGTGVDTFSPHGTMTRAMYVTALGRMAGVDIREYPVSTFADVQTGVWYAPYVEWAVKTGITVGTGNQNFSANDTITREQMATMTLRYFEHYQIPYQTNNSVTTAPADLVSASPWAANAIVKLWQAGLFVGDKNGNFNPHAQATRAEAAASFMRSDVIVKEWQDQNQPTTSPTSTSTPEPSSNIGAGGGNSGNNNGGNGAGYTLTFESNGGSAVTAQKVREGKTLNKLPVPAKEGFIFQGWFRDSDLSLIFAEGSSVTADTKLYAKYIDNVSNAVQSIPSYSVLDVAPGFTITVNDASGKLTAEEVKAGMTFVDTAGPDSTGISVIGMQGTFNVVSAAEDGRFEEGHTYELTLMNDNLSFQGQDVTTSIYVFSVAKQEAMNIPLNPNMVYLPFEDVKDMKLNGENVDSPAISVVTATVGNNETALAEANKGSGTFKYVGSTEVKTGNIVAIYEGIRPDERTVNTSGSDDGDVAYIQITKIEGNIYTYDHADAKQVLFRPDVLPVSEEADTDGDPSNNSITIEHVAMNYSDSQYEPFGLSDLTTVDVGDFIAFYEGEFAQEGSKVTSYGRITRITPVAEMDIIEYTDATMQDIEQAFNIYQHQAIDGDQLLSDEDIAKLEEQIERQAIDSGFVDQAAKYLSTLSMETDTFKAQARGISPEKLRSGEKIKVENLTVVASLGTTLKNIAGRTSGVSAKLQVGADIVIRIHDESDLVIHMTGTFIEEISLDLGINGDLQGHWLTLWGIPYWYSIDDYIITANLDARTYTGINITAEIATVEHDKLGDALDDWLGEKNAGRLGKVLNIAKEIQALLDGVQDTGVDSATLKAKYQEMLENDTDWVPLIEKTLLEKSMRVVFGLIEIKFEAKFVVKAKVNLTIGTDFNYKTAKRYSVTLRVLSLDGNTSTVSLPGDGDYQFTFYVMGTLGLRAGIHLELQAGIGSVDWNSIGISVEPGAYVNLWGYFYYQLKNMNGVKSTRSSGALYVEIGLYLEVEVGAQLGDGAISGSVPVYENTWPLYTVGEQTNVFDFSYPQDDKLGITLAGKASSLYLPTKLVTMSLLDLKTGDTSEETYLEHGKFSIDPTKFDVQIDNPNFSYNKERRWIRVVDTSIPVSTGNLVITWKGSPLTFNYAPLKRTIPLIWLSKAGDYTFQLDPQNGEMTEVIAAAYNAKISVATPIKPGYTFNGWYTEASGGTKMTIPSQMPAEDRNLYAQWIANTNTAYTVEHYLIDPNTGTASSPVYTETLAGTTEAEIRITSDKFKDQGYRNSSVSGVYIKGDGSTVARLYYAPANRTMSFNLGYTGSQIIKVTEQFGKNIAARIPSIPSRLGYTFAGWTPEVPSTMPTVDTNYTAKWIAREDTSYQVVYLQQNISSNTYTVVDTESYRGTTGTEVDLMTIQPKSYENFTIDYSNPGTVLKSKIAGDNTTTLKLFYKRSTYKMKINYNGAGMDTSEIDVPYGATTSLRLGTPIRQGYTFAGWLPAPPQTMPNQNVEFTAQWTGNNYTVSFNVNGASQEVADQTLGYGDKVIIPTAPTREDYVFGGWYRDITLTNAYDFATAVVSGNFTLYAKWNELSYTVSFDSSGGTSVPDQTVKKGAVVSIPTDPTREGYEFAGWYRDNALTNGYDFTTAVVTGDMTLYAKWNKKQLKSYTVSFDSNGGTSLPNQTVEEGAVVMAPENPTQEGYVFDGWYSDNALTSAYNFKTAIVTDDITLYAKWIKKQQDSLTVTFDSNGGTSVPGQTVQKGSIVRVPTSPTREGYSFVGWFSDSALTKAYIFSTRVETGELTLYASWSRRSYTVVFNERGGTPVSSQTVGAGEMAIVPEGFTREGHTFAGWFSDSALTKAYNFTDPVVRNISLYAKWTINSYTVSFNNNGGGHINSVEVIYGNKINIPSNPGRDGYVFGGWYIDPALTELYNFKTSYVYNDITLYAKWTVNYTVSFETNGGSAVANQSVIHGESATIPNSNKDSYAFEGWYIDADLTEVYDFKTPVTSPITLYAKWITGSYTFTFDSNGGSSIGGGRVPTGGKVSKPTGVYYTPRLEGYVLAGWYSDSSLTSPYDFETPVTADITLYAKWVPSPWQAIGSPTEEYSPQYAIDSQGNLFAAFAQGSSVIVKKYENGEWIEIGNSGGSNVTVYGVDIGIDSNDTLYITYSLNDGFYVDYYTVVRKYDGFKWDTIGSPTNGLVNKKNPKISFDGANNPYVVYSSAGYEDRLQGVVKYDGTNWVSVSGGIDLSKGAYYSPDITFDKNNTPYLFFRTSEKTVLKYEDGSWKDAINDNSSGDLRGGSSSIAFGLNNELYFAYSGNNVIGLTQYTIPDWEPVGISHPLQTSSRGLGIPMVVDSKGTLYIAYNDVANGNRLTVMKYDGSWHPVGEVAISGDMPDYLQLIIDSQDNIYVMYQEITNQGEVKTFVKKYEPSLDLVSP